MTDESHLSSSALQPDQDRDEEQNSTQLDTRLDQLDRHVFLQTSQLHQDQQMMREELLAELKFLKIVVLLLLIGLLGLIWLQLR